METRTIIFILFVSIGVLTLIYLLVKDIHKTKRPALWYSLVVAVPLLFSLSFHCVPSRFKIFPKDNLTFSNTIITEDDINNIIERFNEASFMEKSAINNEPLVRKLMQKGIIVEKK